MQKSDHLPVILRSLLDGTGEGCTYRVSTCVKVNCIIISFLIGGAGWFRYYDDDMRFQITVAMYLCGVEYCSTGTGEVWSLRFYARRGEVERKKSWTQPRWTKWKFFTWMHKRNFTEHTTGIGLPWGSPPSVGEVAIAWVVVGAIESNGGSHTERVCGCLLADFGPDDIDILDPVGLSSPIAIDQGPLVNWLPVVEWLRIGLGGKLFAVSEKV